MMAFMAGGRGGAQHICVDAEGLRGGREACRGVCRAHNAWVLLQPWCGPSVTNRRRVWITRRDEDEKPLNQCVKPSHQCKPQIIRHPFPGFPDPNLDLIPHQKKNCSVIHKPSSKGNS